MLEQGGILQLDIYQYLPKFYHQNLNIMTKPFTGFLWMG